MTAKRVRGALSAVPLAIGGNTIPEHAAMKGHALAQSGFCWVSGQHCMPSGMSIEESSSTVAVICSAAASIGGDAKGPAINPTKARIANKRLVNPRFTKPDFPIA